MKDRDCEPTGVAKPETGSKTNRLDPSPAWPPLYPIGSPSISALLLAGFRLVSSSSSSSFS